MMDLIQPNRKYTKCYNCQWFFF